MTYQGLGFYVLSAGMLLFGGSGAIHAQTSLPSFFTKNAAQTPFSEQIEATAQEEIVLLREKQQAAEQEAQESEEAVEPKREIEFDRRLQQPKSAADILETYGDPSAPYPVAATEDAPGPFKAIYAAMNAGDDELAFRYALQYAKFQEQLKAQNNKAVALIGHAKRKAGVLPAGSWPDSPAYREYAYLQDLEIEGDPVKEAEVSEIEIEESTRDYIAELKKIQFDLFSDREKEIKADVRAFEEKERNATQKELAASLPQAKDGAVDVLVFLKTGQDESIKYGAEIEKLIEQSKDISGVNVASFLTGGSGVAAIKGFQSRAKVKLPLLPGNELAKRLGVKKFPVAVFALRDGKSHVEAGFQNYIRLSEIAKIMRGGQHDE